MRNLQQLDHQRSIFSQGKSSRSAFAFLIPIFSIIASSRRSALDPTQIATWESSASTAEWRKSAKWLIQLRPWMKMTCLSLRNQRCRSIRSHSNSSHLKSASNAACSNNKRCSSKTSLQNKMHRHLLTRWCSANSTNTSSSKACRHTSMPQTASFLRTIHKQILISQWPPLSKILFLSQPTPSHLSLMNSHLTTKTTRHNLRLRSLRPPQQTISTRCSVITTLARIRKTVPQKVVDRFASSLVRVLKVSVVANPCKKMGQVALTQMKSPMTPLEVRVSYQWFLGVI